MLHLAAEDGDPALVDLFLDFDAEGEALHGLDDLGWTPLFAAAWRGHQAIADRLLARGAATDIMDSSGRRLIDVAATHGVVLEGA